MDVPRACVTPRRPEAPVFTRRRLSSTHTRSWLAGLVAMAAAACATPAVVAQQDVWVPELPMTQDSGTSARALGLGGAYLALSDDAAALRYNPAGLARVSRIEFSGGVIDRNVKWTTTDHGRESQASEPHTRVSNLGFVYPFPTYRGSMVIALGYHVPYMIDRKYVRSGPRTGTDLDEAIYEEGSVGEWSFGYAVDVSPSLALGFRTTLLSGSYFQDWTFRNAFYDEHNTTDSNVSGYTFSLGAQARLGRWGRLGLVMDLPRWVKLQTDLTDAYDVKTSVDEDLTLPFSFGAGLSATMQRLLLTGDLRLTDWTQIDYQGPMRYTDEAGRRELAYRRTLDLHMGAEYLLDISGGGGLRLRAGVAREPDPYTVVFTDITEPGDPVYFGAQHDPERLYFTGGVGVLFEESLAIDAAFATGRFAREGGQVKEEVAERRLLVSAGFRLD
jgi:hypothetical protein